MYANFSCCFFKKLNNWERKGLTECTAQNPNRFVIGNKINHQQYHIDDFKTVKMFGICTSTGHKDRGNVQQVSSGWHEKLWEQFEWQHYTNRPTIHPTDSLLTPVYPHPHPPLTSLVEGTINQLYKWLGQTRTSIPSSHGLLTLQILIEPAT